LLVSPIADINTDKSPFEKLMKVRAAFVALIALGRLRSATNI